MSIRNYAVNGVAENHGNPVFNMGPQPQASAAAGGGAAKPPFAHADEKSVVVFVAKDKEFDKILQHVETLTQEKAEDGTCQTHRTKKLKLSGRPVTFVEVDAMGEDAAAQIPQLLTDLRPTHVTTVGFLAGKKEDLGKARFFSDAVLQRDSQVFSATRKVGGENVWRHMGDDLVVRDKAKTATVLTVDSVVDGEDAVNALLTDNIVGIDMEIAHIFKAVHSYNEFLSEEKQALLLPAIKGISDNGDKADRDGKAGENALLNASKALIIYLKHF